MNDTYKRQLKLHEDAIQCPRGHYEIAITSLIFGLHQYCAASNQAWGPVGDDSVLSHHILSIAQAIVGLLDGNHGRLDAASIWGRLDHLLKNNGFEKGLDT